jgi:large subunit ribosomal protein L15
MTKRRSKKNKSGSHGHGSSKKNRGAGSRGGRGNAGSGKKGQSKRMTEEGVQEMGETGFNSRQPDQDGINLKDIDQRIEEFVESGAAEKDGDTYIFYAEKAGYDKVLGGGELRKDIEIHADKFSETVEQKVEEAKLNQE